MLALVLASRLAWSAPEDTHLAQARGQIPVRAAPDVDAARIGWLSRGESFRWVEEVDGPGCQRWARLEPYGYACLTSTEPTDEPPTDLPRLVRFDFPDPSEWEGYLRTLAWDRDPDTEEALLPYIYGKRWRKWDAPLYASVEAWARGDEPLGRVAGGGTKEHFVAVEETDHGAVLVREDGKVAPLSRTHVYPITRFMGRELAADPVTDGWLPGWVVGYDGAAVYDEAKGEVVATLPYHQSIDVRPTDDPRWWEIKDALGPGVSGYADDHDAVHHWVPAPAPAGVAADQLWVDVALEQQILALRRGEELVFATLVSAGASGPTPKGVYRIVDKAVHEDMASAEGAEEPYHVEEVPWIMHFYPRYALHGAFWHWGMGHPASHGCVNLAPRDARWLFDHVHPALPAGWAAVSETAGDPGTLLRVRHGSAAVPDRRPKSPVEVARPAGGGQEPPPAPEAGAGVPPAR